MKKDGFTLVELLAVVIILAIISLFVMPKVADLINSGNSTNTSIIEQKLLAVARTYTNDYDTRFFNRFVYVGYASIITKDDLIDAGLVTSDEVALVEDFRGVRVELLDNNKIKYTIARLGDSDDYTNEELYQMINDLKNDIKTLSSQITNNTTSSNMFLKVYPVGSIYISTSSKNPGNIYGGTWDLLSSSVVDTGWQDFSWTNSTYIGTTQKSYTSNKWRIRDNILYINIGAGATSSINTGDEFAIAQIPVIGNTSFNTQETRIWAGGIGQSGAPAGFYLWQTSQYIEIHIKPHTSTIYYAPAWFSSHYSVPLDDGFKITTGTYDMEYKWKRTA